MRSRRRERLARAEVFRLNRRLAQEDVTCFGEELVKLHVETLTTELDADMRADYQRALDAYEDAKALLAHAERVDHVVEVVTRLEDGRFSHACVLARRDGAPLPDRREPCFFDPAHGPATRDVTWAPPGGVERSIGVCFRDAERLAAGETSRPRLVRLGDRHVPWYAAGPAYEPWASGWYHRLVASDRMAPDQLTTAFVSAATLGGPGWSDPGGWTPQDLGVGHDYGHGGDGAGGWDGGWDGGGAGDGGGGSGGD